MFKTGDIILDMKMPMSKRIGLIVEVEDKVTYVIAYVNHWKSNGYERVGIEESTLRLYLKAESVNEKVLSRFSFNAIGNETQ